MANSWALNAKTRRAAVLRVGVFARNHGNSVSIGENGVVYKAIRMDWGALGKWRKVKIQAMRDKRNCFLFCGPLAKSVNLVRETVRKRKTIVREYSE
jgi:hypothetical protein